jgi:hypothetical protein
MRQIRHRQHELLEPPLRLRQRPFPSANRFAHLFDLAHERRRVAAAFLDLADLAGEAVLLFLQALDMGQRLAPLAVEGHKEIPVDLDAARRHPRFRFVQIFA